MIQPAVGSPTTLPRCEARYPSVKSSPSESVWRFVIRIVGSSNARCPSTFGGAVDGTHHNFALLRSVGCRSNCQGDAFVDFVSEQFIEIRMRADRNAVNRNQIFAGLDIAERSRRQQDNFSNSQPALVFVLLPIKPKPQPSDHGGLRVALRRGDTGMRGIQLAQHQRNNSSQFVRRARPGSEWRIFVVDRPPIHAVKIWIEKIVANVGPDLPEYFQLFARKIDVHFGRDRQWPRLPILEWNHVNPALLEVENFFTVRRKLRAAFETRGRG